MAFAAPDHALNASSEARPFLAEAEAIVAAQREAGARRQVGVSWSGLTSPGPAVEDVEMVRQRIAPLLTTQRALAADDAKIQVAIAIPPASGVTTLDALCIAYDLGWCERADIRSALAAGRVYLQADQGGWSKLPKGARVSVPAPSDFAPLHVVADVGRVLVRVSA